MNNRITSLCLAVFTISLVSAQNDDQIVGSTINEAASETFFHTMKNLTHDIGYKDSSVPITLSSFQESTDIAAPKELFIGLIFAPFAATTFEGDPPFSTDTSLFLTAALVKGDWSVAPYYNFGTNSAGAFLTYNIIAELGTYISSDKALTGNTGTYALGFTTPILEDYIQGYVEIGGTYGDDATAFFGVGLYFNILKSVKSW